MNTSNALFNPTYQKAILLIIVGPNDTDRVYNEISQIPQVESIYRIIGPYDFIVHLKVETINEIRESLKIKIRTINGVKQVRALLVDKKIRT
jgi:DNA-binding Lrp family transcriptional regulator